MRTWHYQVHNQIQINAPIDRVYTTTSNPEVVPTYAPDIRRVELVEKLSNGEALVRSHLKVAGLPFVYLYRYRYHPPIYYGGVQERAPFVRGYFSFSFERRGEETVVSHTEGIMSRIPGLATLLGIFYFHVLARDLIRKELLRLRNLVENQSVKEVVATPSSS